MPRMLVNFKKVTVTLNDNSLFEELSFSIQSGKLLALIGANGCGKSTILKLILHQQSATREPFGWPDFKVKGDIFVLPGIDMAYLPQMLRGNEGALSGNLPDSDDTSRVRAGLCRDFGAVPFEKPLDKLSDGELQKRAIISTLASHHELYLFDEPTNYLDIAGITAFERHVERLKRKGRGVLLITHDRTLTDTLADQTVFITKNGIFHTEGGATAAWAIKTSDFESRRRQAKDIKTRIRRLQDDARAKAGWAAAKEKSKIGAGGAKGHISRLSAKMAKRAKAMQARAIRQIEKLEKTKPYIPKVLNLHFSEYDIRNREVFSLKDVSFRYGTAAYGNARADDDLLHEINISASTRDKVCLMGTNGSGKSTIIGLALQNLQPTRGDCCLTSGVKNAYVPQGLAGFYQKENLLDNFDSCGCDETTIRQYLGAALLRKEKVCEPIGNFSYGELMFAAIVKCILEKAEFLFLDEPTSHLDIESIEVLEQLLQDFGGGFLLISHDRSFVANVADKLYVLDGGRLRQV
ncbi:MAG: ATP-binding cassette domain-containing protein [Candidatus Zixiibacteriota bacterium]